MTKKTDKIQQAQYKLAGLCEFCGSDNLYFQIGDQGPGHQLGLFKVHKKMQCVY